MKQRIFVACSVEGLKATRSKVCLNVCSEFEARIQVVSATSGSLKNTSFGVL